MLDLDDLQRIEEAALDLLAEVGLAIPDADLREALVRHGFATRDGRVTVPRQRAARLIAAERDRNGRRFVLDAPPPRPASDEITAAVSTYPSWVHDIETDEIVPYTAERLRQNTRLAHALGLPGVPGCPTDAPPALRPVIQYHIAATHSAHARRPVDPRTSAAVPYIAAMAEVLGESLTSLPVYVFSPLTLAGESLQAVLDHRQRLTAFRTSSMPAMGSSAPIHAGDGYALAAAEVIGAATVLQPLLELPVRWDVSLYPTDLRTMMMIFGSPENLLLQRADAVVDAFFHGRPIGPAGDDLHTNAPRPGAQASAEKASLMTASALMGTRHFWALGTIALDDVFSAEQLIYDLEIRDHVQRLVRGMDVTCDPRRCVETVRAGIANRSFAGLEDTVAAYKDVYWHPAVFERASLGTWLGQGAPTSRQRARERVRELLRGHDYALDADRRRALDAIVARARVALG